MLAKAMLLIPFARVWVPLDQTSQTNRCFPLHGCHKIVQAIQRTSNSFSPLNVSSYMCMHTLCITGVRTPTVHVYRISVAVSFSLFIPSG